LQSVAELWQSLLESSEEKRFKLLNTQKREHFLREADEVSLWILDRKAIATAEETVKDLEHVEMLQKKFDDFQKAWKQTTKCTTQYYYAIHFRIWLLTKLE